MRKNIFALMVYGSLSFSSPVQADTFEQKSNLFRCIVKLSKPDVNLNNDTKAKLLDILQRRHARVNRELKLKYRGIPGVVANTKLMYQVKGYLGEGYEGIVYLVERNNHKYVLKFFFESGGAEKNIAALAKLRERGALTLEPLSVDKRNHTVLFPYIKGVSIFEIFTSSFSQQNGGTGQFQFSRYFLSTVAERYMNMNGFLKADSRQTNTLLDIDTGKFIVIDPF